MFEDCTCGNCSEPEDAYRDCNSCPDGPRFRTDVHHGYTPAAALALSLSKILHEFRRIDDSLRPVRVSRKAQMIWVSALRL